MSLVIIELLSVLIGASSTLRAIKEEKLGEKIDWWLIEPISLFISIAITFK